MIISFNTENQAYFNLSRQIRYKVFVLEQEVPEELEYDEFEAESQHYLLFIDNEAVATCRWRHTTKGIKLERFAVLAGYRGQGLGEQLVRHLLDEVLKENKPVYLHAQVQVTPFYSKLGFNPYGEIFEEAGIRHYLMVFEG
jgi:predicted GNAT family N-acyltransferase